VTHVNEIKMIEFTEGNLAGEKAYVTYDDGEYLRVTPVNGDPLLSIEVNKGHGGFIYLPA